MSVMMNKQGPISDDNPLQSGPKKGTNTWAAQATTDAYADLGDAWNVTGLKSKTVVLRNTGATNGANYKILGSVDGVNYVEVVAEQSLAASTSAHQTVSDYFTHLKVQIKAAVAAAQTDVAAEAAGLAA